MSESFTRTVEELNRVEALAHAVRHRVREETPDEIVEAAEKYFAFLQGNKPTST